MPTKKHENLCEQQKPVRVSEQGGARTELLFQRKIIFGFQKRGRRWEEGSHDPLLATELQLHSSSSPAPEATSCSGHLPCCFKACFLATHGLFHRATCAWPLGIRRLSPVNYGILPCQPIKQQLGGEGAGVCFQVSCFVLERSLVPSQRQLRGKAEKEQASAS